ncbi:MAG TPA: sialidase family protein, partial [Chloroflexota bacterium]|nr:sialidase family protein [Chloroflexota bacterium]
LQQVAFSPAFAHDRTVFAVVVTGGFPGNMAPGVADTSGLDNTGSLGVLVSTDGGEQWSQASVGLEAGGVPFRHVMNLTVSPTFAADGTLFAFAWGRRGLRSGTPYGTLPLTESAIFRSRDRGASWAPVHVPPLSHTRSMEVVVSPAFAADGVALATDGPAGGGPRSFGCDLLRTEDWGETWTAVRDAGPSFRASCGVHLLAGPGEVRAILLRDVLDCATCMRWLQSLDAGLPWERIPGTEGDASPTAAFAPSPAYAADRTLFFGRERGGILALGPTLRSTAGTLPCESEPVGGFGRLWRTEPWLREQVGCPTGAERSVQVRERRYTFTLRAPAVGIHQVWQRRAYRLEDEPGRWFDLGEGDAPDRGGWHTRSDEPPKTPESPDATMSEAVQGPDAVMSGAVQAFEAGTMLFLIRPDGGRVILALGESAWREFPDPPA